MQQLSNYPSFNKIHHLANGKVWYRTSFFTGSVMQNPNIQSQYFLHSSFLLPTSSLLTISSSERLSLLILYVLHPIQPTSSIYHYPSKRLTQSNWSPIPTKHPTWVKEWLGTLRAMPRWVGLFTFFSTYYPIISLLSCIVLSFHQHFHLVYYDSHNNHITKS